MNVPSVASPMSLRRDIQALRGFAVGVVVLFHAGFPLTGGYLGVDLFFAISGFVITGVLLREISGGQLPNLVRFALRRIKRLTLPLLAMVFTVLVLAMLFMSPAGAQRNVSETALGVLTLRANYVLAENMGGYFDSFAQTNPLLHTWSLAVEEQFYVLFPIFVWGLAWFARKARREALLGWGLLGLTFFSLVYAFGSQGNLFGTGSSSYFGPVARVWEFSAGALSAWVVYRFRANATKLSGLFAWVGMGLVCVSLLASAQPASEFLLAQVAMVFGGSFLMIAQSPRATKLHFILENPALVKIGDYSYSLYLWHWPGIVFATLFLGDSIQSKLLGVTVGLLIGVIAHKLVDKPLQRRPLFPVGAWLKSVIIAFFIVSIVAISLFSFDMKQRFNSEWHSGDLYSYGSEKYFPCQLSPSISLRDECFQSSKDGMVTTVVFGDSHAQQLFLGLAGGLPEAEAMVWATGQPTSENPDFQEFIEYLDSNESVTRVIYTARWLAKLSPEVLSDWGGKLRETIAGLKGSKRTVFLVEDVPNFPFEASDCLVKPLLLPAKCEGPDLKPGVDYVSFFEGLEQAGDGLVFVPTRPYFCEGDVCSMNQGGVVLYGDSHHLNPDGAAYLFARIRTHLGL